MQEISLSDEALALLHLHLERRGNLDVDDNNREAYRELARAGIMAAGHTFVGGDESIYRLTREGFERKAELLVLAQRGRGTGAGVTSPSPDSTAAPRR